MTRQEQKPVAVVVNDDPIQLRILSGLLAKSGIAPLAFESAEAALASMDFDHPPDLLITDLYMPGIDGWRFCRLLRSSEYAAFNKVPIMIVSATFAGEHPERIAADIGADVFLSAPVDREAFGIQALALLQRQHAPPLPRVLIVEDERSLAELLEKSFVAEGYRADAAFTADEARAAFAATSYDVAVLDYHLPDGTGETLLDAFRAERPGCVYLMMTGDPTPELALSWMKRGASAYLRKPFEPQYLVELCARARRERALLRVEELLEARTQELRGSEQRFRIATSNLPGSVWTINRELHFTLSQGGGLAQIGLKPDEVVGMTLYEFFGTHDRSHQAISHHLRALSGESVSYEYTHKDITFMTYVSPIHDPQGDVAGVLGLAVDITDRKRADEEHENLLAQLAQAQKMESIGLLAGGIAHDFNNMLGVILGHAELAMNRLASGDILCDDLEEIRAAAQRSANLTRQLLAFARKQAVAPKVLDFNAALKGMLTMLKRLIGEEIDLVWKPGRRIWQVKIDPTQLDQILANLCVNARDAIAGTGKIIIETRNTTCDEDYCNCHAGFVPGDYVMLAVSDDGCGMDTDTLSRLFEPFFTTKEIGKGSGLGLPGVYGAVKQNNGFINVYSEPGRGTTAKIYLPRHAAKEAQEKAKRRPQTATGGNETILLVEDEPAILRMATTMLERLGYAVLTASTPGEAIRLAAEYSGHIDLVMTDVVMPQMNGSDLVERLLAGYPEIKRLFMSGYTADIILHRGVPDKEMHFIQKPFSMEELAAKLRNVLETG